MFTGKVRYIVMLSILSSTLLQSMEQWLYHNPHLKDAIEKPITRPTTRQKLIKEKALSLGIQSKIFFSYYKHTFDPKIEPLIAQQAQ